MSVGRIEARGLWKKFSRGRQHDSLRDFIPSLARRLFGQENEGTNTSAQEFWAVRDVSFSVGPGESLALIGHNGAGKSTLLKVLTRVVRPTKGTCTVTGRLGALVEIAAGFHPDLTGRENIQLQGAILGMSKQDVASKFDAIVDFSGISEFIDTPVKRYSTGMMARLGFSIAAHIEPDVLIIDEVLSVGDMAFQAQANARIKQLATSGRPVVIVSHQLSVVEDLCRRAILLERGQVLFDGETRQCIARYMGGTGGESRQLEDGSPVIFDSAAFVNSDQVHSGGLVELMISGHVSESAMPDHVEPVAVMVRSSQFGIVSVTGTRDCGLTIHPGAFSLKVTLQMNLAPGLYALETIAWDRKREAALTVGPVLSVRVSEGPRFMGFVQLNVSMVTAMQGHAEYAGDAEHPVTTIR